MGWVTEIKKFVKKDLGAWSREEKSRVKEKEERDCY